MTTYRGTVKVNVEIEFDSDKEFKLDGYTDFYRDARKAVERKLRDEHSYFCVDPENIEVKPISDEEAAFTSYEYYDVDMEGDEKVIHIFGCVWDNDGREDGPYTVTEYTFCEIPVKKLVACKDSSERWGLICDYEANVKQYEGDYEWDELVEAGYGIPSLQNGVLGNPEPGFGTYLHYNDITEDTPCGSYYYTY